jgi:hypothetical protein
MLKLLGVPKVGDAGQLVQTQLLACAQSSGPKMLRFRQAERLAGRARAGCNGREREYR